MAFDAVNALLEIHGTKLVGALERALPRTADATGALCHSIHFTIQKFGLTYRFQLSLADYYEWVDKGRRPGKRPPISSIIKWIKDKRLVFHPKYGLQTKYPKSKLKQISDDLKLSKKLAWGIATKISKHGTKGTGFYSSTVPDWIETLKKELPRALAKDVLVQIKEDLK